MIAPAPKLSILLPVFNEASHLNEIFAKLSAVEYGAGVEFVFIDDCSTDGSGELIQELARGRKDVLYHRQARNSGKGAAIRRGIGLATGSMILIQDADLEYEPQDIPGLIQPLLDGSADVVYGSRFKKSAEQVHRTWHLLGNQFLTLASNMCSGLYFSDMETCYKAFRSDLLKNIILLTDRFGFEPEVTAKIAKLRVRVKELPIHYYPRWYDGGKKITWRDGLAALWFIVKFNLLTPPQACRLNSLPAKYIS